METQPISPYGGSDHVEESPKKKSVMGKVKDKARKLKTKVKKPKSPGSADKNDTSSSSSSEDESGSEPGPQSGLGAGLGAEREVKATPGGGLKGNAYEAVPDPHVSDKPAPTAGVEQGLGQLKLDEPAAPGTGTGTGFPVDEKKIAGFPSDEGKNTGFPVDEGRNVEGKDLLVTPTSTDPKEATPEGHAGEGAAVGAAAAAAAGAGALAGKSQSESNLPVGEKKSMLEQAKERIFGSTKKAEGEPLVTGESQPPTITERATNTATGLKDSIATKLGYGSSNKNLTGESGENVPVDPQDPANKSTVQKLQEGAAGTTAAVTSKLGYGEKPTTGEGVGVGAGTGDNKTYTERASDAVYGAKDAVAAKLGYGGAGSTDTPISEGDQKSYATKIQESAVGAKDAVASKLGSTGGDPNVPASTAERFHPGEEDRALSQLITEKMSTGATTVKDTLMRPFGGKSGPPTPTTTPPPSTAQAVAADPLHNAVPDSPSAAGKEEPGIVGKVTGAVTSLLGTSGSGKKRDIDETTSKASEDTTQAASEVH